MQKFGGTVALRPDQAVVRKRRCAIEKWVGTGHSADYDAQLFIE